MNLYKAYANYYDKATMLGIAPNYSYFDDFQCPDILVPNLTEDQIEYIMNNLEKLQIEDYSIYT